MPPAAAPPRIRMENSPMTRLLVHLSTEADRVLSY